ncbi:MAG: 4-amino-4-deoxy-L-arabinose transferase [Flavobacteriales bacterium CG_4_9_14_3_um_filter_40_17]|nr:MAG: 4-amino-4-deoxy-L-arabinose transferase [Flavobacteriales bacterium CG_4_9_14_3_um_filter_40_17]
MVKNSHKLFFWAVLGLVFIVNLIQAGQTNLLYDEAYYWYFAKDLDWGYFDHPPMVAAWIAIGQLFFEKALGIRLLAVLSYIGTVFLLWKMIDHPEKRKYLKLFFLIVFGLALFNIYGFFMVPDTPLIFFAALFLYAYKNFLKDESWFATLLMGFSMAGLMYSKYHGLLLIVFVVLSNLKLIWNKKFLVAVVFGLILFIPHFYWLYEHDFVSVRYHLFERNRRGYRFENNVNYLIDQIAVAGLLSPFVYWSVVKYKWKDVFQKGLKFVFFGFLLFFLFSSFQKKTQAQWVVLNIFPLIIFCFLYAVEHVKFRKWVMISGLVSLILLTYLRFALVFPAISPISHEVHWTENWVKDLQKKSGNLPAVFYDSYKNAALYSYHTGLDAYSVNSLYSRENQYSLDDSEEKVQGKQVVIVNSDTTDSPSIVLQVKKKRKLYGRIGSHFESYRKAKVVLSQKSIDGRQKHQRVEILIENPYRRKIFLDVNDLKVAFLNKRLRVVSEVNLDFSAQSPTHFEISPGKSIKIMGDFILPDFSEEKPEWVAVSIAEHGLPIGFQGVNVRVLH